MSVNAKASLRLPTVSNASLPSTASLATVKATSADIAISENAVAGGAAVGAQKLQPVVDAKAPATSTANKELAPNAQQSVEPVPEAGNPVESVPVNNAASESSPSGADAQDGETGSTLDVSESAETEALEDASSDAGDLVEDLGAEAWASLTPEQRPKIQAMLNALQSRHLKASHGLRKVLAHKDKELNKWRAQKAAQEKKTMDDFMGAVLKVVSQTTGPETQACLQQALEDLNQRPEATIAEKASAFLPFVAQAQIMTAKASSNKQARSKMQSGQISKERASIKPAARQQPTSKVKSRTVGLDIAANRSLPSHKVNPKSSRSTLGDGQPFAKKKKLNSGQAKPASLGFVFSSALNDPSSNHRYGKFTFD